MAIGRDDFHHGYFGANVWQLGILTFIRRGPATQAREGRRRHGALQTDGTGGLHCPDLIYNAGVVRQRLFWICE